ncbi:DUF4476 domain-containing protein [Archangium violaceum]|uniref:DUF4476 domain-containing protein n=1 Tax=Archangium violaceum TaxID=83451 RepID=UPI00193C248F|nr:DUF4476 domain-containing protein [Archangium violaceum]QRK09944.1 DUF4476 domain-containing protein [Archangium violaceum]
MTVPALAQGTSADAQPTALIPPMPGRPSHGHPGPPGRPPTQGTPVVVDRDALMQQLSSINEKLAIATGRAKKDKQLQKLLDGARAELKETGRQVSNAPLAQTPRPPPAPPPPQPTVHPISDAMLRSLTTAIRNEPFADDQLNVLGEATSTQYFLVSQAQQILRLFSFSSDRLKAMRMLRPRLLDLDNGFKLYEAFDYSSDKDELKRILATQTP